MSPNRNGDEEETTEQITSFAGTASAFKAAVLNDCGAAFKGLHQAIWEENASKVATDYLLSDDGLLVGAFASLIRAAARGAEQPYLTVLSELKDAEELGEMALDD